MPELKLGRLPDRIPVKLSLSIAPELHAGLTEYAALYASAYGREEAITNLIPAMLSAFLESDREFQRSRLGRSQAGAR